MRIGVLRRYSPFLLALAVTAVIVVILFLRPDAALGVSRHRSGSGKRSEQPVWIHDRR